MVEFISQFSQFQQICFAIIFSSFIQIISCFYVVLALRESSEESNVLNRQTFGLLKRVEGIVASKQQQICAEYDAMLSTLSNTLPKIVSEKAGREVQATQRQILMRLAELEPKVRGDKIASDKMNELIKSTQELEFAMMNAASYSVEQVLFEARKFVFSDTDDKLEMNSRY